jgi:hypothetical protein
MIIKIITEVVGYDGWIVEMQFNDRKAATFRVDNSKDLAPGEMFDITIDAIVKQLDFTHRDLNGNKLKEKK